MGVNPMANPIILGYSSILMGVYISYIYIDYIDIYWDHRGIIMDDYGISIRVTIHQLVSLFGLPLFRMM
jgi:hypothetical protein